VKEYLVLKIFKPLAVKAGVGLSGTIM